MIFLPDPNYHRLHYPPSQSQSRPDLSVSLHSPWLAAWLPCVCVFKQQRRTPPHKGARAALRMRTRHSNKQRRHTRDHKCAVSIHCT